MEDKDWTLSSLKAYLDSEIRAIYKVMKEVERRNAQRFADAEKALEAAFKAQEKLIQDSFKAAKEAVSKAEIATDKRFDSVNEFRLQLADQTQHFLMKAEYIAAHQSLIDKIEALTVRLANLEGISRGGALTRAQILTGIGVAIAFLTAVIYLVGYHIIK